MKQIYTATFFVFSFLLAHSQDYNLSFEQWDSVQHHIEPRMWGTFNGLSEFGLISGAERTTDAVDGQYALKLRTDSVRSFNAYCPSTASVVLSAPDIKPNSESPLKVPHIRGSI